MTDRQTNKHDDRGRLRGKQRQKKKKKKDGNRQAYKPKTHNVSDQQTDKSTALLTDRL